MGKTVRKGKGKKVRMMMKPGKKMKSYHESMRREMRGMDRE